MFLHGSTKRGATKKPSVISKAVEFLWSNKLKLSSSPMESFCLLPPSQFHCGFLPGLGTLSILHRNSRHSFFPITCCNWGGALYFLGEWEAQIHFKNIFLYLFVVFGAALWFGRAYGHWMPVPLLSGIFCVAGQATVEVSESLKRWCRFAFRKCSKVLLVEQCVLQNSIMMIKKERW